ncbi:MAG: RNA polymerase sigma-70 factor [Bacteroidales bacterium]|nr:RNA polymerase sigma-70 factor [Bacteroidales bacterium]MCF8389939.1 RNA polymerase sigma-70 factor [Bacteroidales bacterium]
MFSKNFKIEKDLCARLKSGDILAFEIVYNLMSEKVYHFALKILRNEQNAEEVLQESFIKLWENHSKIDIDRELGSYIFTITHRLAIDHFRLKKREDQKSIILSKIIGSSDNKTEKDINFSELKGEFDRAIAQLSPSKKEIFHLSRIQGLSNDEIAKKLGISKNTVENQIVNSLKIIREKLKHFLSILITL